VRRGGNPDTAKKRRGRITQMLDRFVEARVKRSLREERSGLFRRQRNSSD
jgi:hypothetical protein